MNWCLPRLRGHHGGKRELPTGANVKQDRLQPPALVSAVASGKQGLPAAAAEGVASGDHLQTLRQQRGESGWQASQKPVAALVAANHHLCI